MKTWHIRDKEGEVCIRDIDATAEEVLVALKASNTRHPDLAPHQARTDSTLLITGETLDPSIVSGVVEEVDPT